MTSAQLTNAEHTQGLFVRPNGQTVVGPLPPNAGDIRVEYDGWIAAGGEPEPYAPPDIDLVAYAANARWLKEISGATWNGHFISTDRESGQPKLLAEFVAIMAGVRVDPSIWKFSDTDRAMLSNADMTAVCMASRTFIANAYAVEGAVCTEIAAGTITTTAEIDAAFAA